MPHISEIKLIQIIGPPNNRKIIMYMRPIRNADPSPAIKSYQTARTSDK